MKDKYDVYPDRPCRNGGGFNSVDSRVEDFPKDPHKKTIIWHTRGRAWNDVNVEIKNPPNSFKPSNPNTWVGSKYMTGNTPPAGHPLKLDESHGAYHHTRQSSALVPIIVVVIGAGLLYVYFGELLALIWLALCLMYPFRRLI